MLIDKFLGGKNAEIKEEITQIKENPDYRFTFSYLAEESNIQKLLCLDGKKEEDDEGKRLNEEKEKEASKKKIEEKKKRMLEKFKTKQNLVLERNLSKTSAQGGDEDVDLCLLCHEKEKPQNAMVYLSTVNKDKTICCSLYGK